MLICLAWIVSCSVTMKEIAIPNLVIFSSLLKFGVWGRSDKESRKSTANARVSSELIFARSVPLRISRATMVAIISVTTVGCPSLEKVPDGKFVGFVKFPSFRREAFFWVVVFILSVKVSSNIRTRTKKAWQNQAFFLEIFTSNEKSQTFAPIYPPSQHMFPKATSWCLSKRFLLSSPRKLTFLLNRKFHNP